MRNIDTLKNTSAFKEVYEYKRSAANQMLVLYSAPSNGKKLGISVSKKVGNSVIRHRAARLIRESYLHLKDLLPEDTALVVVGRSGIVGKKQADVEAALLHLCRKQNLVKENEEDFNLPN
ncbi:MAG: ribonuclease P protein component [Acidaminococcaceae bacterium]|nr:ribonuclease P protein component [Acidaminococcaceae bacterium]